MEISKRDWLAMQVDVSLYGPVSILEGKLGRLPTTNELAEYIAKIRYLEADAILDYTARF